MSPADHEELYDLVTRSGRIYDTPAATPGTRNRSATNPEGDHTNQRNNRRMNSHHHVCRRIKT